MTRAGDGRKLAPSVVLVGLALVLWSALYAASAEARRIALVIGNGDYVKSGDLHNPPNDARAMADKLKSLGFKLVGGQAHVDVNRDRMLTLLSDLGDALDRAPGAETTALVYYSGHGVAQDGDNWLVPVNDGAIVRENVPERAVGTNTVMRNLERTGGKLNILIFDACRNNQLESKQRTKGTFTKGLMRVKERADTVMIYAASHGQVAYDGPSGGLSPFTEALIEEMDVPGRRLLDVVGHTADRVREETKNNSWGAQIPKMDHTPSVKRSFYFVPCSPGSDCPDPAGPVVIIKPPLLDHWKDFEQKKECNDCPLMVAVPAGEFIMGDGRYRRRSPVRSVSIKRFAVGVHEVTFSQWDACHRAGGCTTNPGDNGWGRGNRPVIDVSWDDAIQYVAWLSSKTGKKYRLLSESEWEYAARAGTKSPFHTGSSISTDQANYQNSRGRTVEVGTLRNDGNRFGLYDVHGNVWEWVEDCWHGNYSGAPRDGRAWTHDGDCGKRMFRGGSWENPSEHVSSAYRWGADRRERAASLGFRVARTLN